MRNTISHIQASGGGQGSLKVSRWGDSLSGLKTGLKYDAGGVSKGGPSEVTLCNLSTLDAENTLLIQILDTFAHRRPGGRRGDRLLSLFDYGQMFLG